MSVKERIDAADAGVAFDRRPALAGLAPDVADAGALELVVRIDQVHFGEAAAGPGLAGGQVLLADDGLFSAVAEAVPEVLAFFIPVMGEDGQHAEAPAGQISGFFHGVLNLPCGWLTLRCRLFFRYVSCR